jgi:hypothetical protein
LIEIFINIAENNCLLVFIRGIIDISTILGRIVMNINVGDILTMKKKHPCGSFKMAVLRSGMDFKLRCEGCGHEFMVPRSKIEKNIKSVESDKNL